MNDDTQTLAGKRTEIIERTRPHGCFTALAIGLVSTLAFIAGMLWLASANPALLPGDIRLYDAGRAGGYALLLLLFGVPSVVFLKQSKMRLWRGFGLLLTVAGIHALLQGQLLTLDRGLLAYPGLPYLTPAVLNFLFVAVLIALKPKRYLKQPNWIAVLFGLFLGGVLSFAWVFFGVLGTPLELFLSLVEVAGIALVVAALMPLIFAYDGTFPMEWPRWTIVIVSTLVLSLLPAIFATRGFQLQGVMVVPAVLLAGFAFGALVSLDENPMPARQWPALFAFLFISLSIPLIFTEGLEGEWMLTALGSIWAQALAITAGVGGFLSLLMLGLHGLLRKVQSPVIPGVLSAVTIIAVPVTYFAIGGQGFMQDGFFVVLEDQVDTSFAADIEDRDERVTAVYESLVEHAEDSQGDLRAFLDERDADYTPYYLVNGIEVRGGRGLRAAVARQPGVERIIESPPTRSFPALFPDKQQDIGAMVDDLDDLNDPGSYNPITGVTWGVEAMQANRVWEELGITGQGVIIGNADSGVDWQHPDLMGNYAGSDGDHDYTWFDPWDGTTEPTDTGGHGTHTAGSSFGGSGIGVAPGAEWIACRNLARNLGNPAVYLDCMQFLFAPFPIEGDPFEDGDPTRGAHVTNNSWGCPLEEGCDGETIGIGAAHLRHAGQMMVVSAGNDGPVCETVGIPATNDDVLSVGAVNNFGVDGQLQITFFSSQGPADDYDGDILIKPDVVAPGQNIYSAAIGGGYTPSAGTSMAGPHVAGLVALMWSANPELIGNIELTEFIIYETSDNTMLDLTPAERCGIPEGEQNNVFGFGFVNALAAVQQAIEVQ